MVITLFLVHTRNRVQLTQHAISKILEGVVVDADFRSVAVDEFSDSDESQVSVNTLMRLKVRIVVTDFHQVVLNLALTWFSLVYVNLAVCLAPPSPPPPPPPPPQTFSFSHTYTHSLSLFLSLSLSLPPSLPQPCMWMNPKDLKLAKAQLTQLWKKRKPCMCILIFHLSDPRMAWMSEHLASTNEWQRAIRSKRSSSVCGRLRRSSVGCRRWTSDRGSWRTGASPWRRLWEGRGQVRAFCMSLVICQPWGWGVGWIYSIGVTLPSNQLQRSCRGKAQAVKLLVRVLIQRLHYASFYVQRGWLDDNRVEWTGRAEISTGHHSRQDVKQHSDLLWVWEGMLLIPFNSCAFRTIFCCSWSPLISMPFIPSSLIALGPL